MKSFVVKDEIDGIGSSIKWAIISDAHIGATTFNKEALLKVINKKDIDKFLFLGDTFDAIGYRDKRFLPSRSTILDDEFIKWWVQQFLSIIEPIKEKIVGIAVGNHELKALKLYGVNLSQLTAQEIGCLYLGHTFYLIHRLRLNSNRYKKHFSTSVTFVHSHGWGSGTRTVGGALTKYGRLFMTHPDADVLLVGHEHSLGVKSVPCVRRSHHGSLCKHSRYLVLCGGFMDTFSPNEIPSYAEEKGFPLSVPGWILVEEELVKIGTQRIDRSIIQLKISPMTL